METPVFVELHPGPRLFAPRGPIDITPICLSVSWGEGVEQWVPITIQPKTERYRYGSEITPYPGDWIVVREHRDGPAVALGRVTPTGGSSDSKGPGMGRTLRLSSITAESWLSFLSRVSVYVGVGLQHSQGTMMTLAAWEPVVSALGKSLSTNVGTALEAIIRELLLVTLPPSLGSATLADSVAVVHDAVTSRQWTDGSRAIDSVPGPTVNGLNSLEPPNGTTILGIIQGTFGADPAMIEMFPTLETGGTGAPAVKAVSLRDDSPLSAAEEAEALASGSGSLRFRSSKRAVAAGPAVRRDADGGARLPRVGLSRRVQGPLGANLVLNYRMRPWRTEPLSVFKANILSDGRPVVPIFESVTWRNSDAQTVEQVPSFQWTYDDASTVNAATASIPFDPDSPVRFFEQAGLPIVEQASASTLIREEGLRLFQPHWPFLPPYDTLNEATQNNYLAYLRAVALQGFQFHYRSKRFFAGPATCAYDSRLRCGKVTRLALDTQLSATGAVYVYAETVRHVVQLAGPTRSRRTMIDYSRGLFDESLRSTNPAASALGRGAR